MEKINNAISKIFKDTRELKRDESNKEYGIFYLGKYYPKWGKRYEEMDKFSKMVLNTKKDEEHLDSQPGEYHFYYYKESIKFFMKHLLRILSDTEEFVICVMPSSEKGTQSSGIRKIAEPLCSLNRIDGTDCIYRIKTIPKKHLDGERNLEKEIDSLSVQNESIIKDKIVLLLDDVTTTGTTFEAGIHKLKSAGAEEVIALALGKTTY